MTELNHFFKDKTLLLLVLIALLLNFTFLQCNLNLIKRDNPKNENISARSIVQNQTIYSVDNEYYLSPVDNYLKGKGWMRDPAVSNGDFFRRVPGYSLFYLFFIKVFGYKLGFFLLKWTQVLCFILSILVIYSLLGIC